MEDFLIGRCGIQMREPKKNVSKVFFFQESFLRWGRPRAREGTRGHCHPDGGEGACSLPKTRSKIIIINIITRSRQSSKDKDAFRFKSIHLSIIILSEQIFPGRDLAMKLDIDVYESLCGMKRAVKTLDNRDITISTRPGEVSRKCCDIALSWNMFLCFRW